MTRSSIARVRTSLGFEVPDVPPLVLSLALQAGRTTGRPLPQLLRDPGAFADAQRHMHDRWQHDIAVSMRYAAAEAEAFGAEVAFYDEGPPNVASLLVRTPADLARLPDPDIETAPPLAGTLEVVSRMKADLAGRALVAAVAVGPLSGPVMWMGMERWLTTLMSRPDFAEQVVARYRAFALAWARAQLAAGADALIWFEPLASTEMLPLQVVHTHAAPALRAAVGLGAPVCLHLASARALDTVELAVDAGVALLSVGTLDDPTALARAAAGRVALLGALDGVSMVRWTGDEVVAAARRDVAHFGASGGHVICDAHGEIPFQVDPSLLDSLVAGLRGL